MSIDDIKLLEKSMDSLKLEKEKEKIKIKVKTIDGITLLEKIKKYELKQLLLSFTGKTLAETQSKRGNVYEKIWDIVIKFGFCDILGNDIYDHYYGNNNTCGSKEVHDLELYIKNMKVFSKGPGGSSDITLKNKKTGKWIFISSKYYLDDSTKKINDYDVGKIMAAVSGKKLYKDNYYIYLIVNDKEKLKRVIERSQITNDHIKDNIHHILDSKDLKKYYQRLRHSIKDIELHEVNSIFCNKKTPLLLRFHQDFITYKQMIMIEKKEKNILLGAKARSGKTYCIGGLFIKYYKKYNILNALIVTPAPTETLSQFTDDLFHKFQDFYEINIIEIKKG
jgi:hypothetical protein